MSEVFDATLLADLTCASRTELPPRCQQQVTRADESVVMQCVNYPRSRFRCQCHQSIAKADVVVEMHNRWRKVCEHPAKTLLQKQIEAIRRSLILPLIDAVPDSHGIMIAP